MRKLKLGKKLVAAATAALLACLCVAGAAFALQENGAFTVTTKQVSGLEKTEVTVDFYKVADVNPDFSYTVIAPFESLDADYSNAGLNLDEEKTASWWEGLMNDALAIVKAANEDEDATNDIAPTVQGKVTGTQIVSAPIGLYLMVPQSVDTLTRAYTFNPAILSLPTSTEGRTDRGSLLYQLEVDIKGSSTPILGDIEIEKTLANYNATLGPVTFVYQIEATMPTDAEVADGVYQTETVYSNTAAITFDAPGVRSALLKGIPVAADVTVTEVYTGPSYESTTPLSKGVTVLRDDVVKVTFENTYNHKLITSNGIENQFTYSDEAGKWSWNEKQIEEDMPEAPEAE